MLAIINSSFFLISIDDDMVLDLDYKYFMHYIEDRMGFNTIIATNGLNNNGALLSSTSSCLYKVEITARSACPVISLVAVFVGITTRNYAGALGELGAALPRVAVPAGVRPPKVVSKRKKYRRPRRRRGKGRSRDHHASRKR